VRPSLLSVPAAAGLDALGFEPVGDVLGCTVVGVLPGFLGGCGDASDRPRAVVLGGGRWSGHSAYLGAMRAGYAAALSRLLAEASALDADGVVGINLSVTKTGNAYVQLLALPHRWGGHTTEFFAIGTAVRPIRDEHTIATPTLVLPLSD
jgi:uncharacterized protein YbjQ (UPF0145 family)